MKRNSVKIFADKLKFGFTFICSINIEKNSLIITDETEEVFVENTEVSLENGEWRLFVGFQGV